MRARSLLLGLPALALLAGCSLAQEGNQPRPLAAEVPPLPPAPAPIAFDDAPPRLDGHYAGTLLLVAGLWPNCPAAIPASVTVANGQMAMNLGPYGFGGGMIGGDGEVNVIGNDFAGAVVFTCEQLGGRMQYTTCPYAAKLNRLPSRS